MNDYIAKRAVAAGEYLLLAKATVNIGVQGVQTR